MDEHREGIHGEESFPEEGKVEVLPAIRETTAVDRSQIGGMLRPVADPVEIMEAQEQTRKLIEKTLKVDRDFGVIPGTKKPTLLKPGAERVAAAFGCHATFKIIEKEVDHDRPNRYIHTPWEWGERKGQKIYGTPVEAESQGLYRYVILCELVHRLSGLVIGSGVGSCSSMETKYISRPRDLENTVLKMAKKRAFIDATLTTFGLSDQFTQDTEDMPREHFQNGGSSNSSSESSGDAWSIDSPAIGKKCKGRSWREMCEQEAGYVIWSIGGTESFPGMDNLSESQREQLDAELDRLEGIAKSGKNGNGHKAGASEPSSEHTPEEAAAFLDTLLTLRPETGKHPGSTWLQIFKEDPAYFQKVLTQGWAVKFREDEKLLAAIEWAVAGGLERMKLEGMAEPRSSEDEPLASVVWIEMIRGQNVADLDAFATVHPDVPDDMNQWDEVHYQVAVDAFRNAEAQGGAAYVLKRAGDALKAKEAPENGDGIPDDLVAQGVKALQRSERLGLDISKAEAGFGEAVRDSDIKLYRWTLDNLRTAFFRKASGKS